jgi:hypothetical protein
MPAKARPAKTKTAPKERSTTAAKRKPAGRSPKARSARAATTSPKPAGRPATVEAYLAALPEDRRLPKGYAEGMAYGMIWWSVPHSIYPAGYRCDPRMPLPFAGLASQKGYMSLYLMCVYGSDEYRRWFESEWKKTGKKLDMGKSCIRFKRLEDLPLDLVGEAIARVPVEELVAQYESQVTTGSKRRKS